MVRWLVVVCGAAGFCVGLASCTRRDAVPRQGEPERSEVPSVELRVYVFLDDDFIRRFGNADGTGRRRVNDWLYETERQMQAGGFPVVIRMAGMGRWRLPAGALDGTAIWAKHVPQSWPGEADANCMIALTGREGVYWSGVSKWPRIFSKAQAAEPIDVKTVNLLCHEISHWFGATDIIDPDFPELSVMNYKARHFAREDGRVQWDKANRERMLQGLRNWRH